MERASSMKLINEIKDTLQERINKKNRKKLTNLTPTIIASNCTGGFLYHWLGLQFRSPFINLYMTPNDFITALEHFDEFINYEIEEVYDSGYNYPVGKSAYNTIIHFMHYPSFQKAIEDWNKRKQRIDYHNIGVMLTNWSGDMSQLERFDHLPFKHKVVFTDCEVCHLSSVFCLKGYNCHNGKNGNIYSTQHFSGTRYIDQFDYVDWLNHLED